MIKLCRKEIFMDKNKQDQTVAEVEYNGKIINIYDPAAALLIEQLRNKNNKKEQKTAEKEDVLE